MKGLEPLYCGSLVNQNKSLVRRHLGALKAPCDPPTWCGAATTLCAGDVETPILCGRSSLVEPGTKVVVIVFTEETWWPSSNTLSECYNNVDVGVPLWLTEPRDKHPRQEFASFYPAP